MRKFAFASIVLAALAVGEPVTHKIAKVFSLIAALTLLLFGGVAASYAAGSTWVSAGGSPANDCLSPAAPCSDIGNALSKTDPGGTVHVLSGNYISFSVTKAVQIIGDGITSSLVFIGGSAAITVQAGPSDVVSIRGLNINQKGSGGGITFTSGAALHVEDCIIMQTIYNPGLNIVPNGAATGGVPTEVTVRHTVVRGNGLGNVIIKPTNGVSVAALFDGVLMQEGLYGIRADDSSGSGLVRIDVRNSVAKGNTNNGFLAVGTGTGAVHFMIDHSTAENNAAYGAVATGNDAFMIVTDSTLMGNGTGLAQQSGATVASTGTNTINFNTTNTSGTITPITLK